MVDEVTVSWSLWQAEPNERGEIRRSLYVQLTTQRRSHAGAGDDDYADFHTERCRSWIGTAGFAMAL